MPNVITNTPPAAEEGRGTPLAYPLLLALFTLLTAARAGCSAIMDGGISGGTDLKDQTASVDHHAEVFARYSCVKGFGGEAYNSKMWQEMQQHATSLEEAKVDVYAMLEAVEKKDVSTLLQLTEKYKDVDGFLAARLMGMDSSKVVSFAKEVEGDILAVLDAKGHKDEAALKKLGEKYKDTEGFKVKDFSAPEAGVLQEYANHEALRIAIERFLKEQKEKGGGWDFRDKYLKDLKNRAKNRAREMNEVLDSGPITKKKEAFVKLPDTGWINRETLRKNEDVSTAGTVVPVRQWVKKTMEGDSWGYGPPFITEYGEDCKMREVYARELEEAVKCMIKKGQPPLNPLRCFGDSNFQSMIVSAKTGGADNLFKLLRRWVTGSNYPVGAPGGSNHQNGTALDVPPAQAAPLLACLPSYWREMTKANGFGLDDWGHLEVNLNVLGIKLGPDGCTMLGSRRYCQGRLPGEKKPETVKLPPEGTFEEVTDKFKVTFSDEKKRYVKVEGLVPVTNADMKLMPNLSAHFAQICGDPQKGIKGIGLRLGKDEGRVFILQSGGREVYAVITAHSNQHLFKDNPGCTGFKRSGEIPLPIQTPQLHDQPTTNSTTAPKSTPPSQPPKKGGKIKGAIKGVGGKIKGIFR